MTTLKMYVYTAPGVLCGEGWGRTKLVWGKENTDDYIYPKSLSIISALVNKKKTSQNDILCKSI